MLSTTLRKPPPENCGQCELSYPLGDIHTTGLVACIYRHLHVSQHQALCPWYSNTHTPTLKDLLKALVPTYLAAFDLLELAPQLNIETIVNIITRKAGSRLSTIEENQNAIPDPNMPT